MSQTTKESSLFLIPIDENYENTNCNTTFISNEDEYYSYEGCNLLEINTLLDSNDVEKTTFSQFSSFLSCNWKENIRVLKVEVKDQCKTILNQIELF